MNKKTTPAKAKTAVVKDLPKLQTIVDSTIKPVQKPLKKPVQKSLPKTVAIPVPKTAAVKTNVVKKRLVEVNPEHESYFVYLKNPLEYRRQLLECSRKIIYCLKSHQKVYLIRQKKLEEMQKLKIIVRELLYLNKKFNEKLPKYNTGFLEDIPSADKSKSINLKSPNAKKPAEVKTERTEMERLEESLANIEKKLKTLQ